jgi:hypothetical protein
MFNAEQIRELLTAKDFAPFRIHLSDGVSYEIRNHDQMIVSRSSVEVGLNPDDKGIVERFVKCALVHITRIEELQAA